MRAGQGRGWWDSGGDGRADQIRIGSGKFQLGKWYLCDGVSKDIFCMCVMFECVSHLCEEHQHLNRF